MSAPGSRCHHPPHHSRAHPHDVLPRRFTRHHHEVSGVTGVWLQPSVSTIVSSATGALIAEHLPASHAKLTVVVSYILLGTGFLPALLIMGMYFQRLAIYKVSSLGCPLSRKCVDADDDPPMDNFAPADPTQRTHRIHLPPPGSMWSRIIRHPPPELGDTQFVLTIRRDEAVFQGRD